MPGSGPLSAASGARRAGRCGPSSTTRTWPWTTSGTCSRVPTTGASCKGAVSSGGDLLLAAHAHDEQDQADQRHDRTDDGPHLDAVHAAGLVEQVETLRGPQAAEQEQH